MTGQSSILEQECERLKAAVETERRIRLEAEAIAEQFLLELRNQKRGLELLQAITVAANEAVSIEEAMQIAVDKICAFTGWPVGQAYLREQKDADELVCLPIRHLEHGRRFKEFRTLTERTRFTAGVGIPGQVLRAGKPIWVADICADQSFPQADVARAFGLKSGFGFPLLIGSKVVGVVEFFSRDSQEPDADLLQIMTQLGTQLGRVIERQYIGQALQHSEVYFRRLTESSLDLITILRPDGTILYESSSVEQILGYKPEEYTGRNVFEFVHPEDLPHVTQIFGDALQKQGNTPQFGFRFRHKNGSWRILEGVGNNLVNDPTVAAIVFNSRDVTERRGLEQQFLQAQKVQAIGQLAAGVAHDFNNILTAILGYSDMMLMRIRPEDPLYSSGTGIKQAAIRAAALTRQLLAFGRKQMLEPRVLSLNTSIAEMDKMLRRLLGEDVSLVTIPNPNLGRVKADPGQIEQVILNLAVNARDAMPKGGKLTIETDNVTLDEEYARHRAEVIPGDYVMLAVSDNGTGIPPEVLIRLFEPFFTTKEMGKGTGLGLATCHGIVKQSRGHIAVYSEIGQGTTFKVYLPRVDDPAEVIKKSDDPQEIPRGSETVLLVEDEPMLRELGMMFLTELGYNVLAAPNGRQALNLVYAKYSKQIDILVTDVVMPEMGGKDLAEALQSVSPHTRVLFCSGYTEDTVANGGLSQGVNFLAKPYTVGMLARKVRQILES
jgi:PAS domain S-box-containing protein